MRRRVAKRIAVDESPTPTRSIYLTRWGAAVAESNPKGSCCGRPISLFVLGRGFH